MEGISNTGLIGTNTTHLYSVRCVRRPSVREGRPRQRYDVMSSRKNEISNESFIPIYNKITAKLFRLFMVSNELGRGHRADVASNRLVNDVC
jgi:hypothetical protein